MAVRNALILTVLFVALCAVVCAASIYGAVHFSPDVIFASLRGDFRDPAAQAFYELRLPRVIAAIITGASLAIAGTFLQGLLHNPLVDPYLTGSSAGAACAIAVGAVVHVPAAYLPALAFGAALLAAFLTMGLARGSGGLSPERLILAGVALSALFSSVVTLILTLLPTMSDGGILAWLGGSLAGRGWPELRLISGYAFCGIAAAILLVPSLNILRAGDERAAAFGFDQRIFPLLLVATASLLTAVAVTLAGTIGFVGMIVPHVARRMIGGDARWFVPAGMCIGAIVLTSADWLARSILAPLELPLGVLLACIGVPAFLFLAFGRRTATGGVR